MGTIVHCITLNCTWNGHNGVFQYINLSPPQLCKLNSMQEISETSFNLYLTLKPSQINTRHAYSFQDSLLRPIKP